MTRVFASSFLDNIAMGPRTATASEFDVSEFIPEKHLAFRDCPDILTMQDLGMAPDVGISPVAVTQPCKHCCCINRMEQGH